MNPQTSNVSTTSDAPTVRQALQLLQAEVMDLLPNKDADFMKIMEHVVHLNETGIFQKFDEKLTPAQQKRLNDTIKRLKKDEPLEYITGVSHFHGRRFYVSRDTLIPRVETETLVDLTVAIAHEKLFSDNYPSRPLKKDRLSIVDVGTGTGCIVIATALSIREPVNYFATEISEKATKIARKNISSYKLGRQIQLAHGNLLDPIAEPAKFDIIVANLPYLKSPDLPTTPASVQKYEPHLALDGGENGAMTIKELLTQASARLKDGGVILLELQPKIIDTVKEFSDRLHPNAKFSVVPDTFEMDRFAMIRT